MGLEHAHGMGQKMLRNPNGFKPRRAGGPYLRGHIGDGLADILIRAELRRDEISEFHVLNICVVEDLKK